MISLQNISKEMDNMENVKSGKIIYINNCIHCGKPIKDEWKFCPYCKTHVETFECTFCGQVIRPAWSYCPHCKNEVRTELENRLRTDKCNEWLRDILQSD